MRSLNKERKKIMAKKDKRKSKQRDSAKKAQPKANIQVNPPLKESAAPKENETEIKLPSFLEKRMQERAAAEQKQKAVRSKRRPSRSAMKENDLTRVLAIAVLLLGVLIIGGYLRYFYKLEPLTEEIADQVGEEEVQITMPVVPYKAYSIKKADLLAKFGDGIPGEGTSQETKYVEYQQNWFNLDVPARYFYGKETRVYETILSYKEEEAQTVYDNMKKRFGEPIYDNFFNEEAKNRETFWIADSINIFLRMRSGKPEVEMHMAYYENPKEHALGDRPTIVQRMKLDLTGDGEDDTLMLIGTKPEYTTPVYKNLFLLVESKEGDFFSGFPLERDGGESPQLRKVDTNGDGKDDFLVTADQGVVINYNAFEIEGKQIKNIYSSDIDPLLAGTEKDEETKDKVKN